MTVPEETQERVSGFDKVDAAVDRQFYLDYLDTLTSLDFAKVYKQQTFVAMNVKPGHTVLDVGCGTGDDVIQLAKLVGENGRAFGIDVSETMISEAKKRAASAGVHNASFYVSAADRIDDLEDNSVNSCRADRVFQHLARSEAALFEMIRVVKRGSGRIVIVDPDWETLTVDSDYKEITREILIYRCDFTTNPWSGRKLYAMFKRAALADVSIIPFVPWFTDYKTANSIFELETSAKVAASKGLISESDSERWISDLMDRSEKGLFFASVCGFLAAGTKP